MNRCLQEAHVPEEMTKGKTTLIKGTFRNNYRPIMCHRYHSVENTNSTNKGGDLLLTNKLQVVYRRTERMTQRIQWHRRATLHCSAHPQRVKDMTEKSGYDLEWLQKGIRYGSAKLNNGQPQNVQNIRWSHKLYRKNHENLESGIDSRREKLSWSGDPKGYIPRKCPITIAIRNCDDATQPHTQKMNGNPNACWENIQTGHRDGIWHRKMCYANNEERQTIPDRRNGTTKSTKKLDRSEKGNLQLLGNIGSWHHQIRGDVRNNKERVSQENQKTTRDKSM